MDLSFFETVNWWAQIPFFIAVLFLLYKIGTAVKKGMYQEIWSFISICVSGIAIILIAYGITKFFKHDVVLVVTSIVLLILLGILYKLVDTIYGLFKGLANLPIISFLDKLLGIAVALCETIILVWAVYSIVIIVEPKGITGFINTCVENNKIMATLYEKNYLFDIVSKWNEKLSETDVLAKMGFTK